MYNNCILVGCKDEYLITTAYMRKDKDGNYTQEINEEGIYDFKKVYIVKKGFADLKIFENEIDAKNLLNEIKENLKKNRYIYKEGDDIEFF